MRRPSPWNLNTLLARGVLALMLLFAQHQEATHWLSHTAEFGFAKHGGSSPAGHCDECLALGALGTAATAAAPVMPVCSTQQALLALPIPAFTQAALTLAYRSRAPPTLC